MVDLATAKSGHKYRVPVVLVTAIDGLTAVCSPLPVDHVVNGLPAGEATQSFFAKLFVHKKRRFLSPLPSGFNSYRKSRTLRVLSGPLLRQTRMSRYAQD